MKSILEIGRVLGTHGVSGELRLEPWCDSPEILAGLPELLIGGRSYRVHGARIHKSQVLCRLEGVDALEAAIPLVGSTVEVRRELLSLPQGRYFVQDLLGLAVVNDASGEVVGKLVEVLPRPAHNVYRVMGEREVFIPAVDEFLVSTDLDAGEIRVRLIEGM